MIAWTTVMGMLMVSCRILDVFWKLCWLIKGSVKNIPMLLACATVRKTVLFAEFGKSVIEGAFWQIKIPVLNLEDWTNWRIMIRKVSSFPEVSCSSFSLLFMLILSSFHDFSLNLSSLVPRIQLLLNLQRYHHLTSNHCHPASGLLW